MIARGVCEMWYEAIHWLTQAVTMAPYFKEMAMEKEAFAPIRAEIEKIQPAN